MNIGIGSVVLSTAGIDKGRFFLVVAIVDDKYVKIADGELRPQEKAKLKKIKHLKFNGDVIEKIAQKILTDKQVFDAEIRSALRVYNEQN